MGTREGGLKTAAANKAKYGENYYQRIGAKGGAKLNPHKGFGGNRELASAAGKKGGHTSRRTKKQQPKPATEEHSLLYKLTHIF